MQSQPFRDKFRDSGHDGCGVLNKLEIFLGLERFIYGMAVLTHGAPCSSKDVVRVDADDFFCGLPNF